MVQRTFAGFVADFPVELDGVTPAGKELANFVAGHLVDAGFTVEGPCERDCWAWELCTKDDQLEIITTVGLVDDMQSDPPRQWLITNDCDIGRFKRLFAGKTHIKKREQLLRKFCDTLHQIISRDNRFSQIVWYNKETFDKPGDQPSESPYDSTTTGQRDC